ncbi:MAG: DinB family protein [Promethearchaeota archaeon]
MIQLKAELKVKIESWKMHRNLTYDLLKSLHEESLRETVGKNMGSLGKQFRHLGDVQLCYIEAIRTGVIDFSKYVRNYSIESSIEKLEQFLKEMDDKLFILLKESDNLEIDWGFAKIPLAQHLDFLIQHEILHHGELIVYIRTLNLTFPNSWEEIWGPLNV